MLQSVKYTVNINENYAVAFWVTRSNYHTEKTNKRHLKIMDPRPGNFSYQTDTHFSELYLCAKFLYFKTPRSGQMNAKNENPGKVMVLDIKTS